MNTRPIDFKALVRWTLFGLLSASTVSCGRVTDRTTTPEGGPPCMGAKVSLADARSTAVFELVEPRADLASPDNRESIWQCSTAAGGFLFRYGSGVEVLESINTLKDPAAEWQGLADDYREFSTGEINGTPASFADPAVDEAIGGVDFVVGNVRYTVGGNGKIPLKDLILVAESIPIAKPSG